LRGQKRAWYQLLGFPILDPSFSIGSKDHTAARASWLYKGFPLEEDEILPAQLELQEAFDREVERGVEPTANGGFTQFSHSKIGAKTVEYAI
jgi:hypothetical protein